MPSPDLQQEVLKELAALRTRVAELEAKGTSTPPSRRKAWLALFTAGLVAAGVGTAFAASGTCPNGMQYCFSANSPALASEINFDLSQLKGWIETKVGSTASASVTSTGIANTGTLANTGDLNVTQGRLTGYATAGNFHINSGADNSNNTLYLNWHGGSGGVVIGNGAGAQAARFESNGNLQLTSVNGRRPVTTTAATCTTANCAATCTAGVIKSAWGFHGANWNANVGGGWACGSGIQWMGGCIGQSSCSVATSCGSSSLWLECW